MELLVRGGIASANEKKTRLYVCLTL